MTLTAKQEAFIEHYLTCFNAAEAARRAGYKVASARQQGSRLLTNVNIAARVRERIAELKLGADEALVRLAEHARGSMAAFVSVDDGGEAVLNLAKAATLNQLHLVKRIKWKKSVSDFGESVEQEIELYDAQAALVHIGKHHGLFPNKIEVDWRAEIAQAGLDANEIREGLVNEFAKHLSSGAKPIDAGGVSGSTGTGLRE